MAGPDRSYISIRKRFPLLHICGYEKRTTKDSTLFFGRAETEVDFPERLFRSTHGTDHDLEFRRFKRECTVRPRGISRQCQTFFDDARAKRHRHNWSRYIHGVIRKATGTRTGRINSRVDASI